MPTTGKGNHYSRGTARRAPTVAHKMPELAEVETIAKGLRERLLGKTLLGVKVFQPKVINCPSGRFKRALENRRIRSIARRGKFLVISFDPSLWLLIHLGMSGQLILALPSLPPDRHTHLCFEIEGLPETLCLRDPRRFGSVELYPDEEALRRSRLSRIAPDPFEMSFEDFRRRLGVRRAQIKSLLLNQGVLSGLGNIYTDEILFRSGIHPKQKASRLSQRRMERLYQAMRDLLQEAIRFRGTSVSDYVDLFGERGEFQNRLCVYGRSGRPCLVCGRTLIKKVVSGRGTSFCPRCQKKGGD